jgi:hypothetical protein
MNPPSTADLLLDAAASDDMDPDLRLLIIDAANELSQAITRAVVLERALRAPVPPAPPSSRVDNRPGVPPIMDRRSR